MLTEKDLDKSQVDALFDSTPALTRPDSQDMEMEPIEESKGPSGAANVETLDSQFTKVLEKIQSQSLSLADLSKEERAIIKNYLNIQVKSVVDSKYPSKIQGLSDT